MCDISFLLASGASRRVQGRRTPAHFRYLADRGLIPHVRTADGVRLLRVTDVDDLRARLEAEERVEPSIHAAS
jgi:hypothetical protein